MLSPRDLLRAPRSSAAGAPPSDRIFAERAGELFRQTVKQVCSEFNLVSTSLEVRSTGSADEVLIVVARSRSR